MRHTIPLAVTSAVCGLLHLLAPAYADEGAAVAVVPAASPLVPPELVGLPVPSWLTTLLAGAALARYLTTMLAKGVKVTVELVHTLPPGAPHLEIHHNHPAPVQPAPDPTDEHSGVRRAPRRACRVGCPFGLRGPGRSRDRPGRWCQLSGPPPV